MTRTITEVLQKPANFDPALLAEAYGEAAWLELAGIVATTFGPAAKVTRADVVAVVARTPWRSLVGPMQHGWSGRAAVGLKRAVVALVREPGDREPVSTDEVNNWNRMIIVSPGNGMSFKA